MAYYDPFMLRGPCCGCLYFLPNMPPQYLPQVSLDVHATILSSSTRTTLTQKFINPSSTAIKKVTYEFPIYDGVSVVGFRCTIGDRTLTGVVKEKEQAKAQFNEAVQRGETAGYLEQSVDASDVFRTSLGNVPENGDVNVEITFVGELKQDTQTNGVRYVLPTAIAPRYGNTVDLGATNLHRDAGKFGMTVIVDVEVEAGSTIRTIQSPSHPYEMTLARTSRMAEGTFKPHCASARTHVPASSGCVVLDKDFVILVSADGQDAPVAFLESHSTLPNQRAIMASLVPKFSLPNIKPEIVFIIDRSGSMSGNMPTLQSALKVFLKSLPPGVMFNICSFGSRYEFLWPKSRRYDAPSLTKAMEFVDSLDANMGGTEMYQPVDATIKNRYKDLDLEVLLLTDGEIWQQDRLFKLITDAVTEGSIRFFSLGIGAGASSALVEGVARAGNGFAQMVLENEQLDKKVVRMLKGALTPHITDYTVDLEYGEDDKDDFEMVNSEDPPRYSVSVEDDRQGPSKQTNAEAEAEKQPVSLFDPNFQEMNVDSAGPPPAAARFENLPHIDIPPVIQAPTKVPSLYPMFRSTVFALLAPTSDRRQPKNLILRASHNNTPLLLKIPIQDVGTGETVHQLAAKRAIVELEEQRGWLAEVKDQNGVLLKTDQESKWDDIVARECVRLGCAFQIAGKFTAFVALEKNEAGEMARRVDIPNVAAEKGKAMSSGSVLSLFGSANSGFGFVPSARPSSTPIPPPSMPIMPMMQLQSARSSSAYDPAAFDLSAHITLQNEFCSEPTTQSMLVDGPVLARTSSPHFSAKLANRVQGEFSLFSKTYSSRKAKAATKDQMQPSIFAMGMSARQSAEEGSYPEDSTTDFSVPAVGRVHSLIAFQTFEGFWEWDQCLFQLLGLQPDSVLDKMKMASPYMSTVKPQTDRVVGSILATALALIFLRTKARDEKDVWELVDDKAQAWLDSALDGKDEEFKNAFAAIKKDVFESVF